MLIDVLAQTSHKTHEEHKFFTLWSIKLSSIQTGFQPAGQFLQLVGRTLPTGFLESVVLFSWLNFTDWLQTLENNLMLGSMRGQTLVHYNK